MKKVKGKIKTHQMVIKDRGFKSWAKEHVRPLSVAGILLLAFIGVTFTSLSMASDRASANAFQGSVKIQEVSINSKIPGRIGDIYVVEGQRVKAGDPLVMITSDEIEAKRDQLLAQIEQATAGVDAAEAVLAMANANLNIANERVEQARAGVSASESQKDMASAVNDKATNGARTQEVAQAESAFLLMDATYERAKILYDGGAISYQKLEEIRTQRDIYKETLSMAKEGARTEDKAAAKAQVELANSGLLASQKVLSQAQEGVNIALAQVTQAEAGVTAAKGVLAQAQAGLAEVEVYLNDATIKAPIDGLVSTLNSDIGELVSTGTSIGTVSNPKECWVNINVDESQVMDLKEGETVAINLVAFGDEPLEGKILSISQQPDFAIKKATTESGNIDLISYGVKVAIDNDTESVRSGMTAKVSFETLKDTIEGGSLTAQDATDEKTQDKE